MNPQQIVMSILQNNTSPFAQNLLKMAQAGDAAGIEQIARNMMQEKGRDFDTEFENFKQRFHL